MRRHSATKRRAISSFDTAISASRNNDPFSSLAPRPEAEAAQARSWARAAGAGLRVA
ncbi:hypothetical protein ACLB1E_34030 [Escherichia coli]